MNVAVIAFADGVVVGLLLAALLVVVGVPT